MQIRSVLTAKNRPVITIGPRATVSEAVRELVRHNIGSLPVVDEAGAMLGIFTERDVLRGLEERGEDFCHATIEEVMTRQVVSCAPDASVHDAMGRLSDHCIGQLPVLEDNRVVGIVSIGDLVRILYETAEEENRQLMTYVYGTV